MRCFSALCRTLVDARALEHLRKDLSDLITDDVLGVVRVELRMPAQELGCPVRVLGERFIFAEIFAIQQRSFEVGHLFFSRPGRIARPMTSIRPMFSFLMWCSSSCG